MSRGSKLIVLALLLISGIQFVTADQVIYVTISNQGNQPELTNAFLDDGTVQPEEGGPYTLNLKDGSGGSVEMRSFNMKEDAVITGVGLQEVESEIMTLRAPYSEGVQSVELMSNGNSIDSMAVAGITGGSGPSQGLFYGAKLWHLGAILLVLIIGVVLYLSIVPEDDEINEESPDF